MRKKYLAVLCGKVDKNVDNFVDYMLKDEKENCSRIVDKGITGAKRAELGYKILEKKLVEPYGELALAEVMLLTGRHHQIRVQMAGHGLPLWGDNKYNPEFSGRERDGRMERAGRVNIGLSSCELSFYHPVSGKQMTFRQMPQEGIFRHFDGGSLF